MDATFIQDNQIIEHYLMGKLPTRSAQEFERWCRENPDTIAALGLSDRINCALRLLDAAGEPLPWVQPSTAWWQKLPVLVTVAAVAIVAAFAAATLFAAGQKKSAEITQLASTVKAQPLRAVQTTRAVVVEASRDGPVASSQATVGGERAELADFRFDVSWSRYTHFVITIDRADQGRVAVLNNVGRDSNGHVRVALNTSALGPGDYAVEIEGLDLRRGTEPQGWARFSIAR